MARPAITSVRGSIPACAGEPDAVLTWASAIKVHPRVCGGAETLGAEA